MKRIGEILVLGVLGVLGAVSSGCVNVDGGPDTGGARPNYGRSFGPPSVPGVEGPYGTPVPMAAPYNMSPPGSQYAAMQMMNQSVPMSRVQMNPTGAPLIGPAGQVMPPMMAPAGTMLSPPGMPYAPGAPMQPVPGGPGMPPGVGGPMGPMGPATGPSLSSAFAPGGDIRQAGMQDMGPGSGLVQANIPPGASMPGNVMQAGLTSAPLFPAQRTQLYFSQPAGMKIFWSTQGKDGKPAMSTYPVETPGRYNFAQAAIYRLKLINIPGHPMLELYPTLEVVPTSPRTNEFLAHNAVPVEFTEDDFKQVVERNYIVKVIYLPDPQFQDVAGSGPDVLNSTKLEPGQDPIQEALRRGSILLVVRIGNIDQEVPNSPPLSGPAAGLSVAPVMPGAGPGTPPLFQLPYFGPTVPAKPGLVPVPPNALPVLPGLGGEAERRAPIMAGPLPPLPNEQNKNNMKLPFGLPDAPAVPNSGGAPPPPPTIPKETSATDRIPALTLPGEASRPPVPDVPLGATPSAGPLSPLPVPEKAIVELPGAAPKPPTEGLPVSNAKTEQAATIPASVNPPMPAPATGGALPPVGPLNLPPMPGRAEGPAAGMNSPSPTSAQPGPGLALPFLDPEMISGQGLPSIPGVAPSPEKK